MEIDQDRIRSILQGKHSYYGGREVPIRKDYRWWYPSTDLFALYLSPRMRVLDVGCGDGNILFELSPAVQSGLGIDNDPEHIRLAEEEKQAQSIQNVDFRLMDYPREAVQLPAESFDLVYSMRGPVPDEAEGIQAAQRLLKPEGLLFCEEIGERHLQEVVEIFQQESGWRELSPKGQAVKTLMEQHGFEVRLVEDIFTKWIYPDVYAWFQWQCHIWSWLGVQLPEADDPRIGRFAERATIASGEIETTHHVARVGGIKQ
jgi:SAM-dependent methyltransferase